MKLLRLMALDFDYRMQRDSTKVGTKVGGGMCLYVNERWCDSANVCVKKWVCMEDVELISVSMRPRYLPREFRPVFVIVVYALVFDQASAARAGKTVAATVRELQLISTNAPRVIVGDLNHCDLRKILPPFKQFVTCNTRGNKMLDQCYGNIPRAHKSVALPSVGGSDHNTIPLIPAYQPRIETEPIVRKSVNFGRLRVRMSWEDAVNVRTGMYWLSHVQMWMKQLMFVIITGFVKTWLSQHKLSKCFLTTNHG